MANYLSKTLSESDNITAEQKLWRAVLDQALQDTFGVNTIWICAHEKKEVDDFFKERTTEFDEICENAGLDPTRLWRKVQRLKGVQAGFLLANKKEQPTLDFFQAFKDKRNKYIKSHWRNHHVG